MSMTAIAPQTNNRRAPATAAELNWLDYLVYASPSANIAPATLAILAIEFAGEDAGIMRAAVRAHVNSSKWFPSVAELRQQVNAARQQAEIAECHAAALAQVERVRELRQLRAEALEDAYAGIPHAIARLRQLAQAFADAGQAQAAFALRLKAAQFEGALS